MKKLSFWVPFFVCLAAVGIFLVIISAHYNTVDAKGSITATITLHNCNGEIVKQWKASRIYRDGYDESPWIKFRDTQGTRRYVIGTIMEVEFYE